MSYMTSPTGTSTTTSLPSAPPYSYNQAQGGIPQVPDPTTTAGQATAGNLANLSGIDQLTQAINAMNQQAAGQQNTLNQQQASWNASENQDLAQWSNNLNQQIAAMNNANSLAFAGQQNTMNLNLASEQNANQLNYANQLNTLNQGISAQDNQMALQAAQAGNLQNQQDVWNIQNQYVPGLGGLVQQRSNDISAQLGGNVPQGVINQLAQQAAERGAGAGMGVDSPASMAALEQALGTTSLNQISAGEQGLSSAQGSVPNVPLITPPISTAPYANAPYISAPFANAQYSAAPSINQIGVNAPYAQAQTFDPTSLLTTAAQQQDWQYLANELGAAPIPAAAAQSNLNNLMAGMNRGQSQTGGQNQGQGQANPAQAPYQQPPAPKQQPYQASGTGSLTPTQDNNGAAAYQQVYGEPLQPGTGYDPVTDTVYQLGQGPYDNQDTSSTADMNATNTDSYDQYYGGY